VVPAHSSGPYRDSASMLTRRPVVWTAGKNVNKDQGARPPSRATGRFEQLGCHRLGPTPSTRPHAMGSPAPVTPPLQGPLTPYGSRSRY
jgi:hypothetical protein